VEGGPFSRLAVHKLGANLLGRFDTAHSPRKLDVHEHEVGPLLSGTRERRLPIGPCYPSSKPKFFARHAAIVQPTPVVFQDGFVDAYLCR
jgi:hypothetical protein